MDEKYISIFVLGFLLISIGTPAVASTGSLESEEEQEIVIEDATGKMIEFESAPDRIITFGPASTEILFHIDEGERVIATDDFSDHPEEVKDLPKVGGFFEPDYEEMVNLSADVIVTRASNQDIIQDLRDLNENVVATHGNTLEDVYRDIELLGRMCGLGEQAEQTADELESTMQKITEDREDIPRDDRVAVLFIVGIDPIYVPGEGTFQHTLIERAGGNNIARNKTGWATIEEETIIAEDPDMIVTSENLREDLNDLIETDPWQEISAVENDNVFFVNGDEYSRPGPRLIDAQREITNLTVQVEADLEENQEAIPMINPIAVPVVAVILAFIYSLKTKKESDGK